VSDLAITADKRCLTAAVATRVNIRRRARATDPRTSERGQDRTHNSADRRTQTWQILG
jgi:hypothetical protein